MANPLKLLKLKARGFQFIQEVAIDAPPARVWAALLNTRGWFYFADPDWPTMTLEPRIGGRLMASAKDDRVAMLSGWVMHIERGKLLRINGPMGMSHLPVSNAMIFELQPRGGGKKTLLRFCQRAYGYMTEDMGKSYQGGWKKLFPQLKALAEKKARR